MVNDGCINCEGNNKLITQEFETVCIFSAGHSGSTLISLMLGAHPEIFYAGELLPMYFL